MKIFLHCLLIALSFGIAFVWEQTALSNYTIQALAGIILLYLIIAGIKKRINPNSQIFSNSGDIFMLITSILLLISITGNLYSPLFFLLYFLGFGITFIFEPLTVFVFAIGTVIIFLPEVLKNSSIESYIRIGSVFLISPLAYFFGQEYKDRDKQEEEREAMIERTQDAADIISSDVEDVLKKEKKVLKEEDIEKLNQILEQTQGLREEASS
jgi:hypothetical protein